MRIMQEAVSSQNLILTRNWLQSLLQLTVDVCSVIYRTKDWNNGKSLSAMSGCRFKVSRWHLNLYLK